MKLILPNQVSVELSCEEFKEVYGLVMNGHAVKSAVEDSIPLTEKKETKHGKRTKLAKRVSVKQRLNDIRRFFAERKSQAFTDVDVMKAFNLGRSSVRKYLLALVKDGSIIKGAKRGTFLSGK